MLKYTAASIVPSTCITELFNSSLRLGSVPQQWKEARVIPIPKVLVPKSPNNYSPISLLSLLSKVLEQHLYYLITDHLEEGHLLSNSQWGFRSSRSTTSTLLSTFSSWLSSLDSGIDICAIFFDHQKAFDTVPHCPLLDKLSSIAPNSHLISWVANYSTSP